MRITRASLKLVALTLPIVMVAVFAPVTVAFTVYIPTVPPDVWIQSKVSFAVMAEFVNVKETAVCAFRAALAVVMSTTGPALLAAVASTVVPLLVDCVMV